MQSNSKYIALEMRANDSIVTNDDDNNNNWTNLTKKMINEMFFNVHNGGMSINFVFFYPRCLTLISLIYTQQRINCT